MPTSSPGHDRTNTVSPRLPVLKRIGLIACALTIVFGAEYLIPGKDEHAPEDIARQEPLRLNQSAASDLIPVFHQSWVTPPNHSLQAHSSSICALPSGDLLAIWYGGSREGSTDVALFTSRLTDATGAWSTPLIAINREMARDELNRVIKKVGNAVIFPDHTGTLWMVYVSVSLGGWSGSTLNLKASLDEGRTWGPSRRLTLNPFFNLGSLVRNKPIYTSDGRIGLPVYHEMAFKFPQMLWLTPGLHGTLLDYRMRNEASARGLIQPALVPLGDDRMLMMLRDHGAERSLRTAYSDDNGWNWKNSAQSGLPNPDSAVDALRLRDGRILLVYNHAEHGRENLHLAISSDSGLTWQQGATIENGAEREYSYPSIVEDRHGLIHLTYTWQRKRIRHLTFNVAWINQGLLPRSASLP